MQKDLLVRVGVGLRAKTCETRVPAQRDGGLRFSLALVQASTRRTAENVTEALQQPGYCALYRMEAKGGKSRL